MHGQPHIRFILLHVHSRACTEKLPGDYELGCLQFLIMPGSAMRTKQYHSSSQVLLVSIIFSRGNTEESLRQSRGDVKVQRSDYSSVKSCNKVLPSAIVGGKINSGEIDLERKSYGKWSHTKLIE